MNSKIRDENYLIRNLETGFLEIHVAGKEEFLKLSAKNRELLKNKCRWSRPGNCWISKADFDLCKAIADRFRKLGYNDEGWKGRRIPFEKKILQRLNKNAVVASKYERKSQILERKSATHIRNAEHYRRLVSSEPNQFKKQDLKRKSAISERKAISLLENANYCKDQAAGILERSAILELNLANPKYLKSQIYKKNVRSVLQSEKKAGNTYINSAPLADRSYADRLLSVGRIKTAQEEEYFYKSKLKTIGDGITDDLSMFYGKPVFMSKRYSPDGIGNVVGHIPEERKLVLKLNDGSYIAKNLHGLSVLQPDYEILNTLNSNRISISDKSRAEGFKVISMLRKGNPLEAMQAIRKAGLSNYCLIRCNEFLENQIKLKQSVSRSKKLRM
ncbi:MAG: hypothetical protein ACN6O7_00250 [Sphingobacterium sp.]